MVRSCSFLFEFGSDDLMMRRRQKRRDVLVFSRTLLGVNNFISAAWELQWFSGQCQLLSDYFLFQLWACALRAELFQQGHHLGLFLESSFECLESLVDRVCTVVTDLSVGVRWVNWVVVPGQLTEPIIARERRTGALGATHLSTGWP